MHNPIPEGLEAFPSKRAGKWDAGSFFHGILSYIPVFQGAFDGLTSQNSRMVWDGGDLKGHPIPRAGTLPDSPACSKLEFLPPGKDFHPFLFLFPMIFLLLPPVPRRGILGILRLGKDPKDDPIPSHSMGWTLPAIPNCSKLTLDTSRHPGASPGIPSQCLNSFPTPPRRPNPLFPLHLPKSSTCQEKPLEFHFHQPRRS